MSELWVAEEGKEDEDVVTPMLSKGLPCSRDLVFVVHGLTSRASHHHTGLQPHKQDLCFQLTQWLLMEPIHQSQYWKQHYFQDALYLL